LFALLPESVKLDFNRILTDPSYTLLEKTMNT